MPIVWTCPDGTIEIETFGTRFLEQNRLPGEATDQAVTRLAEAFLRPKKVRDRTDQDFTAAPIALVRSADIPTDRTTRSRWRVQNGRIVVTAGLAPVG